MLYDDFRKSNLDIIYFDDSPNIAIKITEELYLLLFFVGDSLPDLKFYSIAFFSPINKKVLSSLKKERKLKSEIVEISDEKFLIKEILAVKKDKIYYMFIGREACSKEAFFDLISQTQEIRNIILFNLDEFNEAYDMLS